MPLVYISILTITSVTLCACMLAANGIAVHVLFWAIFLGVIAFSINNPYRLMIILALTGIAYFVGCGVVDQNMINASTANDAEFLSSQMFYDFFLGGAFWIVTCFICMHMNYTSIKRFMALYKTEKERDYDILTSVKNFVAYERVVDSLSTKIQNKDDIQFAVVIFDVNNLKKVNDAYGHKSGDDLIVRCVKMICNAFKHSPVYRVGGDEFVAILTDEDYDRKEDICQGLTDCMDAVHNVAKSPLEDTSFAFGLASYSKGVDRDYLSVFSRADAKMYNSKYSMKTNHGLKAKNN